MSSSSPPPPPPNPHSNPFNSKCSNSSSSSPTRPNPRRSKTTSNPETSWRREPLNDVTNEILGGRGIGRIGRFERRSPRQPTTSSPPTSPTQQQNHYLHHNLPRSSPPRLRRTYTALDLDSNATGERNIGRGFMELGINNRPGLINSDPGSSSIQDEIGGGESRRTRTGGAVRTRSRHLTPHEDLLPPSLRGGVGIGVGGRRRTLRDVLENSPTPSNGSSSGRRDESENEGTGEEGVSGRRLRRRRTEGGFR